MNLRLRHCFLIGHWSVWLHGNGFSPSPYNFDTWRLLQNLANILQTAFSNVISWWKVVIFLMPLHFVPKGSVDSPHKNAKSVLMSWRHHITVAVLYWTTYCSHTGEVFGVYFEFEIGILFYVCWCRVRHHKRYKWTVLSRCDSLFHSSRSQMLGVI